MYIIDDFISATAIFFHKKFKWKPRHSITKYGEHTWKIGNVYHNETGPASISIEGREMWFYYGIIHRENGPAIINPDNGSQHWYKYGKLHRIGGPAIINEQTKAKYWYQDGRAHREDGPAFIMRNYKEWYYHGEKIAPDKLFAMLPKEKQLEILFNDFNERFK